jgi:hypothetical protein
MNDVFDKLDALDAAEEAEVVEEVVEEIVEEAAEEVVEEVEAVEEESGELPGYLSYDEWVESGKDPSMYKGEKAYKAEYDRIQEIKGLKTDLKAMKETLKSTVDAIHERESKSEARHKAELEAALTRARENGDTDEAINVMEQLNDLKVQKPLPQQPQIHPVLNDFISSNDALNDSEVYSEFARIYDGRLRAEGVTPQQQLSDRVINAYARQAMDSVKQIFPEKFVSPSTTRRTIPKVKSKPAPKKADYGESLRKLKLSNEAPQNVNAHNDIYEMLKERDPKQAEIFAKNIIGE